VGGKDLYTPKNIFTVLLTIVSIFLLSFGIIDEKVFKDIIIFIYTN
jgi:hypothetical protein